MNIVTNYCKHIKTFENKFVLIVVYNSLQVMYTTSYRI